MFRNSFFQPISRFLGNIPFRFRLLLATLTPLIFSFLLLSALGGGEVRRSDQRLITQDHSRWLNTTTNQVALSLAALQDIPPALENSASLQDLIESTVRLQDVETLTPIQIAELRQERAAALENFSGEVFDLVQRSPYLDRVLLFNADGEPLLQVAQDSPDAMPRTTGLATSLVGDLRFSATDVLPDGAVYTSPVILRGEGEGEELTPVLVLSTPIYYRGEQVGGLAVDVQAEIFLRFFAGQAGQSQAFVLLDDAGRYLADTRDTQSINDPDYAGYLYGLNPAGRTLAELEPALTEAAAEPVAVAQIGDAVVSSQTFQPLGTADSPTWTMLVLQDAAAAFGDVSRYSSLFVLLVLGLMAVTIVLMWQISGAMTRPLVKAARAAERIAAGDLGVTIPAERNDEVGRLGKAINSMASRLLVNLATLEDRFTERTRDLEVTAEIASTAVGAEDVNALLRQAVNLVRERFNFYHVQVFLVDAAKRDARLVASTGEAGRTMLNLKWALGVGSDSVIGQVTARGETVIAFDTGTTEVVHRPNPHLPDTRSEMALPMKIGDDVIGALDIQSIYPNAFSQDDVRVFSVLANQLAIAIYNARLLQESQLQVARAEELNRRLTREAWQGYLAEAGADVPRRYRPPVGEEEDPAAIPNHVSAPLAVRGEVIGSLTVAPTGEDGFSEEERDLIDAVADRISLAVENARLVAETQASLAETANLYQMSQVLTAGATDEVILESLMTHFGAPTRFFSVGIFSAERDENGAPRTLETVTLGIDEDGEAVRHTMPNRWGDKPLLTPADVQNVNLLQTPDAISRVFPPPMVEPFTAMGVQTMISLPLAAPDTLLGYLTVMERRAGALTERDVDIFRALAGQVATVVRNRQLFEAVEAERQTLGSVLETMPTAVLVLDAATRQTVLANQQAQSLFSGETLFSLEEAGRLVHADSGKRYPLERIPAVVAIESGQPFSSEEMAIRFGEGKDDIIALLSTAAPIKDSSGRVVSVVAVFQDITELRYLQIALQETLRETTSMYESSRDIFSGQETEDIAEKVLRHLHMNVSPDVAHVLVKPLSETGEIDFEVAGVYPADLSQDNPYPPGLLQAGTSIKAPTLADDDRFPAVDRAQLTAQGIQAFYAMPLTVAGQSFGWLAFAYRQPHALEPEQERYINALTDQAAIALLNARLRAQTEEALNQTLVLYEASREISRADTVTHILEMFVSFALPASAMRAAILLIDEEAERPRPIPIAVWDRESGAPSLGMIFVHLRQELTYAIQEATTPQIIDDVSSRLPPETLAQVPPELQAHIPEMMSLIPLTVAGRRLGVMAISYDEAYEHEEGTLRLYSLLGDQVAAAVDNRRLLERTRASLEETQRLYHASQAIRSADSVENVLVVFQSLLMDYRPIQLNVYLLEETRGEQQLKMLHHWDDGRAGKENVLDVGDVLAVDEEAFALLELPAHFVENADQLDPATTDRFQRDLAEGLGAEAVISLPLSLRTRAIGRLVMGFDEPREFPEADRSYLTSITDQTAIVLDNWQLIQQTQDSLEETRILYETSSAIADVNNAQGILDAVVNNAVPEEIGSAQILLLHGGRWDSPDALVEIAAAWSQGMTQPNLTGMRFSEEQYPGWQELTTKTLLAIGDVETDPRLSDENRYAYLALGNRAVIIVPLQAGQTSLGVLLLGASRPIDFSQRQLRIFRSLSELVTIGLENARLLEQTGRRARQLQTSAEVAQAVTAMLDVNELLPRVVDMVRENFGYDHAQVFLLNPERTTAVLQASTGDVGRTMLDLNWSLDVGSDSVIGQVTATAEPVIALDTAEAKVPHRPNPYLPDTRSEMAVPLITRGGRVIGALDVQSNQAGAFTDEDVVILNTLAGQIAAALENARLFEEQQVAQQALAGQVSNLQTLLEAGRRFTESFDVDQIFDIATRYIVDVLGVDRCGIVLSEDNSGMGTVRAVHPGREALGATIDLNGAWWYEEYRRTQQPVIVPDIANSDLLDEATREMLLGTGVRGIALTPFLTQDGQLRGSIGLDSFEVGREFSQQELALLQLMATQVSAAYNSARLFQQQQIAQDALAEQVDRLEALYAASMAFTENLETDAILATAINTMVDTLEMDHGAVIQVEGGDSPVGVVTAHYGGDGPVGSSFPISAVPNIDTLTTSNTPVTFSGFDTASEFDDIRGLLVDAPYQTLLLVPLLIQTRLAGLLALFAEPQRTFTVQELTLTQTITTQAALAFQNAQFLTLAQRQAEEMGFLFNVTTAAAASDEVGESMASVVNLVSKQLPTDAVAVFLASGEDLMQRVALHASSADFTVPERVARSSAFVKTVETMQQPLLIPDLVADAQHGFIAPGLKCMIVAPFFSGGELLGMLTVLKAEPHAYDETDTRLLQTLSGSLSAVVQNIQLLDDVRTANVRLRELDRIKSQFLANMSHELRTPLNSIIGFSRVILKGIDGPLTDMQEQDLSTIHSSGQHLLRLINDILDQAKIEADKLSLSHGWFEMDSVVEVARSMSVGVLKEKPVRLNVEMEPNLPQVWGDEIRTRQVLINLLSNAAKFTYEGSITISVFAVQQAGGPYIQVSVTDTGIGIPDDNLDSIFMAFEQVDGSLTRTSGGTGLGLPISKSLIEMQGGELWVESTLNVGSTFSFTIPAFAREVEETQQEEEAVPAVDTPTETPHLPARKTVVVVDGEVGMHQIYRRYLNKVGYTVEATANPTTAHDLIRAARPDVVVLDVNLPDADGWALLARLKDSDDTFHMPVVVCTMDPDSERGFRLGAAGYLFKPFLEEDLQQTISQVEEERIRDRILLIDDDPDSVRLICQWLEQENRYEVVIAETGAAGLASIREKLPSLVLLDLHMPDMSGFDVLQQLREEPLTQNLPVLIITAEHELAQQARDMLPRVEVYEKHAIDEAGLLTDLRTALHPHHGEDTA